MIHKFRVSGGHWVQFWYHIKVFSYNFKVIAGGNLGWSKKKSLFKSVKDLLTQTQTHTLTNKHWNSWVMFVKSLDTYVIGILTMSWKVWAK